MPKTMTISLRYSFEPDLEEIQCLVEAAKASGHSFDGCTDTRTLIKRLLVGTLENKRVHVVEEYGQQEPEKV